MSDNSENKPKENPAKEVNAPSLPVQHQRGREQEDFRKT